ncbi:MAG: ABC transporter ATP-binding protein [Planctomycetia bacterium]|nr:ABC transporter ATP-binding protein [Planctomycetia bacterium]
MPSSRTESKQEILGILRRARNLWEMIPPRPRWTLILAVALMALGGLSNTAIPLLLGKLVDSVRRTADGTEGGHVQDFLKIAFSSLALIGIAYLLREALQVGRRVLVEDTCTRFEKHLFVRLVGHSMMTDREALSKEKIGTMHGRMLRNVSGSVRFLRIGFLDFLPALLAGSFAFLAVTIKSPWLGLATAGVIPISTWITLRQLMSQKGVRLELLRYREDLDGTVVEQLGGIDYIRAANTHRQETARVARAAESLRRKELRHHFQMSLYGSGKALIEGLFHVFVLGIAVYLATIGRISVGDILTFSMLFLSVMAPLAEVHRMIDEGHESSLLVDELLKMLKEPIDRCYRKEAKRQPVLDSTRPVIRVENLAVDYPLPQGGRRRAIEGVSLEIRHGEIIGIAGKSGCGKSTLLRALMRLVHPSDGRAEVAGVPLESLACESFAQILGYVGQSPFVFSSTVGENIAYEREGASLEEIREAARTACLDDEIMKIPGGFSAQLAERGQNLSGGQKQRLALARVILKNPPILILDEATSALDTISEGRIQQWLTAARGSQTVILVAHRLSTLLHTDRILVFHEGRIVESGTYPELVERGGVFTELVTSAGQTVHDLATQSA